MVYNACFGKKIEEVSESDVKLQVTFRGLPI